MDQMEVQAVALVMEAEAKILEQAPLIKVMQVVITQAVALAVVAVLMQ
jgi:hypothetical protein